MSDTICYRFASASLEPDTIIALVGELPFDAFEETDGRVAAYVSSALHDEGFRTSVETVANKHHIAYELELIPERNWNQVWEDSFAPVEIGDYLRIRAPFHAASDRFAIELEIVPEMSFGTGHHETTYLMAELLRDYGPSGKTVFDFGTGTGVLAMIAAKLGAREVTATDNDPRCVASTRANAARNGVVLTEVSVGDHECLPHGPFDLILANIQRSVLVPGLPSLAKRLTADGEAWLSGILELDFDAIEAAAERSGLRRLERRQRGRWLALRYGAR